MLVDGPGVSAWAGPCLGCPWSLPHFGNNLTFSPKQNIFPTSETPILWPLDEKNWLIWKDPNAGKDWRQEEKGTIEDEMAEWHHRLNGHVFEWTPGVGDGQGGLACGSPWGRRESDTIEQLNWSESEGAHRRNLQLSNCTPVIYPRRNSCIYLPTYV